MTTGLTVFSGITEAITETGGGGQTPWTSNINGGGYYLYNANIDDPTQHSVLDATNRILSNSNTNGGIGVFDFSGDISNTAGISFHGNNPVFNTYIQDGNGLKSLNPNSSREMFGADGSTQVMTWAATGPDNSYILSFDNGSNAYFNLSGSLFIGGGGYISQNNGISLNGVSITAAGGIQINSQNVYQSGYIVADVNTSSVTANSFNGGYYYGDGSYLTNIPASAISGLATVAYSGNYSDINSPPFNYIGVAATDISMAGHTLNMNDGSFSGGGNLNFDGGTIGDIATISMNAGSGFGGTINNVAAITDVDNVLSINPSSRLLKATDGTTTVMDYSSLANAKASLGVSTAGSFSGSGTATTSFVVTLPATQPNNTYKVVVEPTNILSTAVQYISAKTTTTFTVTYLAGLTGTVAFDWVLTP